MAKTQSKRQLNLQFPVSGLDRRWGYRAQQPYSTPDCLNVYPTDTLENRTRGGSRPGLGKAYYEQLGSGNPIRLLSDVTVVGTSLPKEWRDNFSGTTIGSNWSAASWKTNGAPELLPSNILSASDTLTDVGAIYSGALDMSAITPYTFGIYIQPWDDAHHGTYELYGKMGSSPVATTDGFVISLTLLGDSGTYSGTLTSYSGGTATSYSLASGTLGSATGGWFQVTVNGSNLKAYWQGVSLINQTISGPSGSKFGFGMNCTNAGGFCLVSSFRLQYPSSSADTSRRTYLIASANGALYQDSTPGFLTAISSSVSLSSTLNLQAAERYQKLYIADYGDIKASLTNGTITSGILSSTSVTDWTTLGLNTYDYLVSITSASGGTSAGNYTISSVASGGLTLSPTPSDGTSVVFTVERAPKIFDPAAGTLTLWTAEEGIVPVGASVICRYRDRIVLAKDHIVYMSRNADPLDWDYSQTDSTRAVALQATDVGFIGQKVTALIPYSEDYLIVGCLSSCWIMRGDPAYGGTLNNLSQEVGPVDSGSWAFTASGDLFILTRQGLYLIGSGGTSPQSVSREKLPKELLDIDATTTSVRMAYDPHLMGIHIYLVSNLGEVRVHYWFDTRMKSFWPVSIPTDMEPTSIVVHRSDTPGEFRVLLGSRDGYVRCYDDGRETDEGTEIESHVLYGPIRTSGNDFLDGRVDELIGVLDEESGPVLWSILPGDTHEASLTGTPITLARGTWTEGLNYRDHPRIRGGAFCLKLENADRRRWAVEGVSAIASILGKQRKL